MGVNNRVPVIVGVGETIDQPVTVDESREPVDLMADALRIASKNACSVYNNALLDDAESVDLIGLISWRYSNPVGLLCERLGISPARQVNASMGGETPVRLIHEAALRVLSGESETSLIVGGEALSSFKKAKKLGETLHWTPKASPENSAKFANSKIERSVLAGELGINDPSSMYPLYEMAFQAANGQTPEEGNVQSSELISRYARVAAVNSIAWDKTAPSSKAISNVNKHNRMVCWPYPKLMMANPNVNQAAGVIVTSLEKAKQLRIPDEKIVFIWGGGNASEPDDFLCRDNYYRSAAQEAVLKRALDLVGGDAKKFRKIELYSCFPVVPKMALSYLNLEDDDFTPTVAGGLTFFGGPLNNYMSHAACSMVRELRLVPGSIGMLYGQGGFFTKHHSLVLSTNAPAHPVDSMVSVQSEANKRRGVSPQLAPRAYQGVATIETYTVLFNRSGCPVNGVVVFRTEDGDRGMACVKANDEISISILLNENKTAIGMKGLVALDDNQTPVIKICC